MPAEVDTVVVGAGLSGLVAAHTLVRSGRSVRVLEAGDAVGGRVRSGLVAGQQAEFGGEWIGPHHRHALRLADELGVKVRRAGQLGLPVRWQDGEKTTVGRVPPLPAREKLALLRACWKLNQLARRVDPVRPWLSAEAEELDSRSFTDWLQAAGVRGAGFHYLTTVVDALTSAEQLSLLHVLWWLARGGGLVPTVHTTFAYNFAEGAQTLATRVTDQLGDAVALNSPVRRITDADGVRVETGDGTTLARNAVVTAPVGTLAHIAFDPPLPPALAALDELRGRPGAKVVGVLPDGREPRHRAAIGGSPVGTAWRVGPRLTGFVAPEQAATADDLLVTALADLFGVDADELRSPTVHRWSGHHHIPACDIGFAPGQLLRHGPHLTTPHGRVHFAGAERSSWPNNMEGAIESGLHAARAVLSS